MWSLAICVAGPCGIVGSTISMYPCTNCSTVRLSYSAQCPVLANHTFLWGHCAVRGGLSVGFWDNPPVAAWSVIPAPRRMRWACWAELASALKAAAGSDICCKSCGSNPALLSCSSPMECVGTANCGGVKSLNDSSPSGRMSGPGGPLAAAAARRSLTWAAVGAARPWVEEGAGCVAVVPQAARSCLYLERDGSSWLGPGVGWLAVALMDS